MTWNEIGRTRHDEETGWQEVNLSVQFNLWQRLKFATEFARKGGFKFSVWMYTPPGEALLIDGMSFEIEQGE